MPPAVTRVGVSEEKARAIYFRMACTKRLRIADYLGWHVTEEKRIESNF